MTAVQPGDRAEVGLQSWAGLSWHPVEVLRVAASGRSARVRWLDDALNHRAGEISGRVPLRAIRRPCTLTGEAKP